VDFRDSSRKIAIELKSRSNASGRYVDTIITVHKVEKLLDLIYADPSDLWSVYVVFAFTDKIYYVQLTGLEDWGVQTSELEGSPHFLVPITSMDTLRNQDGVDILAPLPSGLATGILTSVRWKIQLLLRQYKKVIPTWAFDFIDTSAGASDCLSTAKHPRKKTTFSIPSFRDLWKVHKEEIGTRPLHGGWFAPIDSFPEVALP